MEVVATDQGGLQGRCTVFIRVEDVNQAPNFLAQPFTVRIPEDSPVGFHVVVLKVVLFFFSSIARRKTVTAETTLVCTSPSTPTTS